MVEARLAIGAVLRPCFATHGVGKAAELLAGAGQLQVEVHT